MDAANWRLSEDASRLIDRQKVVQEPDRVFGFRLGTGRTNYNRKQHAVSLLPWRASPQWKVRTRVLLVEMTSRSNVDDL